MTTPQTMGSLITRMRERLIEAEQDAFESHKLAMNSYGAGYDRGFADALKQLILDITGEEE